MCPYRAPTDRQHQLTTVVDRYCPASLSCGTVGGRLADWLTDLPSKLMMWVWTSGGLAKGAVSQDGCCDINVTPFLRSPSDSGSAFLGDVSAGVAGTGLAAVGLARRPRSGP